MCGVLSERKTFIRNVEEYDCGSQHALMSEHVDVEDVGDADQNEDQDFPALCELYVYTNFYL